jgi:hypothetical protein
VALQYGRRKGKKEKGKESNLGVDEVEDLLHTPRDDP